MIKVTFRDDTLTINGHAGYGLKGNDIVCASVSCIAITSINAIIRMDEKAIEYKQAEGFIEVKILKHSEYVDNIIDNMIDLLKELEKDYEKYIKIN